MRPPRMHERAETLWKSPGGKTPEATVYATIIREIAPGEGGAIRQVGRSRCNSRLPSHQILRFPQTTAKSCVNSCVPKAVKSEQLGAVGSPNWLRPHTALSSQTSTRLP